MSRTKEVLRRFLSRYPGSLVTMEFARKFLFKWCADCGERLTKVKVRESNGFIYRTIRYCEKCGYMEVVTPGSPMSGPGEIVTVPRC